VAGKAVLLFKLSVEHEKCLGELIWAALETLFEEITRALQFRATVTLEKFRQISVPEVVDVGPFEQSNATLVSLESFLKVVVLLQEECVVHDDLWSGNFKFQDSIVDGFACFKSTKALFKISIKPPNLIERYN